MLGPPCSGAWQSRSIGRRTCDTRRRRAPVMPATAARPPTVSMQLAIRIAPIHRRGSLRVGPVRLERAARAGHRAAIHRHSPSAGDPRTPGTAARADHHGALPTGQIHGALVRLQEHRGRGQALRGLTPQWDADPPARRLSVAPPPPALPPRSDMPGDLTDRLHPHAKHMLSPRCQFSAAIPPSGATFSAPFPPLGTEFLSIFPPCRGLSFSPPFPPA